MERSLDRAYRRLVQRINVPGFRKGKTPRNMLERHVGRDRLVHEAIDILIPETLKQAVEEHDIWAIDEPNIEVVNEEPLSFKATVPIRPTIALGDYKGVRAERKAVKIEEKDLDAMVEELRRRYALHEPAERPVQAGDIVRADVRVVIDGHEVYKEDDTQFQLKDGATILLPGFAEGLPGAEKGVEREIPVTVPEGERPLSGKSGIVTVTVKEVKEERLPELNDDFAREVGEGFQSLDDLRQRLRSDMQRRLEAQAEEAFRERAVEALVEQAPNIEFPRVLVDREIERLIHDQAHASGQEVDAYLEMIKKSGPEIVKELTPAATERVRRSLALTELAREENITVQSEEVDAEIERIATSSGPQGDQLREMFARPESRLSIERSLLTRKTLDALAAIASQDGAKKPTRKKKGADKAAAAPATEEKS